MAGAVLKGDKDLARKLRHMERQKMRRAQASATKLWAKQVLNRAKELAPEESGGLAQSGKVKKAKRLGRGQQGQVVAFFAAHAHLLEWGTAERQHKETGKSVGKGPALHFLAQAVDESKAEGVRIVGRTVKAAMSG